MPKLLSTSDVEPSQRRAFWSDMVCGTYVQLECDPLASDHAAFSGRITVAELAELQLTQVQAHAQLVRRSTASIARDHDDYFLVSMQTEGRGRIEQDGRIAHLEPGDFALYDSTRPYTLRFDDDFSQIVLKLPGRVLRSALKNTERLTASTVRGERGAGHLLINMVSTLARDIDTLAAPSAAAVAEGVTHILVAGLSTLPAAHTPEPTRMQTYQVERIKACIRARLRDPALTVASVAMALSMSPSSLHRAWAGAPCSVSDWIWCQRLDGAKADLCSPGHSASSVSQIAFAWGFNDAAHFSRAFRARFNCTPRQMRIGAGA